ncbi:ATP-binding protein [Janthinobacterium sp. SUN073]|uniref:ATP-binding protein n=1 Tax=Janthinobacterium sp. SUN073 TaxID=3004102 RepID=UPI0025AFC6E7|nr:ATP-binding protein [Janthinobacterium sp. SUN073]MDN2698743.1 ATP-binding protein [Janthinobacterium sp. SUN073]
MTPVAPPSLPVLPADARAPRTVEETGLPFFFLVELLAKVLFQRGQLHLPELASYVKLGLGVIDPVMVFMRQEKMCEVMRRGASGTDADIHYQLTDSGRQRALECLARNAYAGPCPVPLAAYNAQVAGQSVANMHVTRPQVQASFDGVVVNPAVLDQLGAAMNSGRAIFIYGAAGSGKTYLAERLQDLLQGAIALPYAIMVDGEVVPFYDPVLHLPAAQQPEAPAGIERAVQLDARWVRGVRRPAVLTGGELTLEMLDLRFDSVTRLYRAPPHLKANNGIFIIDDLGRQRCSPLELMNRWIVPMDRAIDYLSLHNGHTFQVPFDVVVVFSSNFLPERLSDAAFLRRLGYKIEVPALSAAHYETVFRQTCAAYGVPFDAAAFAFLLQRHARGATPLLACYPRDLLRQVRDLARYEGTAAQLNEQVLDWAWNNYFAGANQRHGADDMAVQERREPKSS